MIGYAMFGTNDKARSLDFYDAVLATLGAKRSFATPTAQFYSGGSNPLGIGVCTPYDGAAATVGNGAMIALAAANRAQVDAAHAKAVELGAKDEGAPGVRGPDPDDPAGFYGAYFRDLDGNKLCVFKYG